MYLSVDVIISLDHLHHTFYTAEDGIVLSIFRHTRPASMCYATASTALSFTFFDQ